MGTAFDAAAHTSDAVSLVDTAEDRHPLLLLVVAGVRPGGAPNNIEAQHQKQQQQSQQQEGEASPAKTNRRGPRVILLLGDSQQSQGQQQQQQLLPQLRSPPNLTVSAGSFSVPASCSLATTCYHPNVTNITPP